MSLHSRIKDNWTKVAARHAGTESFWLLSPSYLALRRSLFPVIVKHASGVVLDAGAGKLPYKPILSSVAERYLALDVSPANEEVDLVADVQDLPIDDSSIDTIFCSQVIEHVPDTAKTFSEFRRVLRPGGLLILTAPHLGYLHNEPHDYYRFTNYGLAHLTESAGLSVVSVDAVGGLVSFLGHLCSTVTVGVWGSVPVMGPLALAANRLWSRSMVHLDNIIGMKRLFALDFLLIAKKP